MDGEAVVGDGDGRSGSVGPQWRSDGELKMKGALDANCNAVGEGPNIIDECCNAIDGGDVVAGGRIVDVGFDAIDDGRMAVDEDDALASIATSPSVTSSPSTVTSIPLIACSSIPTTFASTFEFPSSLASFVRVKVELHEP